MPKTPEKKVLTMEEVAKHANTEDGQEDVWLVIGNSNNGGPKVYDVTKYLDDHPGGKETMTDLAGRNADELFEDIGHSLEARKILKKYLVGDLFQTEEEKVAMAAEAEKRAAGGGGSMVPFLIIMVAVAVFVYLKKNDMI